MAKLERGAGKFTQAGLCPALAKFTGNKKNSRHLLPGAKPLKHLLTFGSQGRNRTCDTLACNPTHLTLSYGTDSNRCRQLLYPTELPDYLAKKEFIYECISTNTIKVNSLTEPV